MPGYELGYLCLLYKSCFWTMPPVPETICCSGKLEVSCTHNVLYYKVVPDWTNVVDLQSLKKAVSPIIPTLDNR